MKKPDQKWYLVCNVYNGTICFNIILSVINCSKVFHLNQAIVSQNSKENYFSIIVEQKQNITITFYTET